MKSFQEVTEHYRAEIVQKWIDYFVLHRPIESERIVERIK